jgi:hypothetical protein
MTMSKRPLAALVLAGAMALALPAVSKAQTPFDTWSHVASPTPYGLCWVPNDKPYMEFGHGYWGACPGSPRRSAALARAEAWRARAEVPMMAPIGVDQWSYVATPGPNGLCWIPNDKPYMEFGHGYWGNCPGR